MSASAGRGQSSVVTDATSLAECWAGLLDRSGKEPGRTPRLGGETMETKTVSQTGQLAGQAEHDIVIDARSLMHIRLQTYRWSCPGCTHRLRFSIDQIEAIPFFIIRHLVREHGIRAGLIAAVEPSLADEAREYCRQMGQSW